MRNIAFFGSQAGDLRSNLRQFADQLGDHGEEFFAQDVVARFVHDEPGTVVVFAELA
jgi:hypothetical protein